MHVCDLYDEEFEKALEESNGDMEYAAFTSRNVLKDSRLF
jgi:type I restriction enzyme M protein